MKIKDAIAYLQTLPQNDECAFDVWTYEDIDRLMEEEFPGVTFSSTDYEEIFNEMEARDYVMWDTVKGIIEDLLDGEI